MPRSSRRAPGGMVYHVWNRSVGKMHMFSSDADYAAFYRVMMQAHERHPLRLLAWCVLSNHWHFVVWPRRDGEVSAFFRWLTHTHAMRWRVSRHTVGYGHLYQGRFKSLPVQSDEHFHTVCRYVERNALTARQVARAEQWQAGSLWVRLHGSEEQKSLLSEWPLAMPADWVQRVNVPITAKELQRLEVSLKRGRPFGSDGWTTKVVKRLGLEHTVRSEGRPPAKKDGQSAVKKVKPGREEFNSPEEVK